MPSFESNLKSIVLEDQPRVASRRMRDDGAIRLAVRVNSLVAKTHGIITVTGVGNNSGSSYIALDVAQALADFNQDKKVLVIDVSFNRPHLHTDFNIPISPGLLNVLQSQNSIDDALAFSGVPGLYVLPAGLNQSKCSAQALMHNLSRLLSTLRDSFDTILLSTPDILRSHDAEYFSSQSDSVIVVIRSGEVSKPQLRKIISRISSSGSKLFGVVLSH